MQAYKNCFNEEFTINSGIDKLILSHRSSSSLKSEGIETIEQLVNLTESGFLRMPNLGRKSLNEVRLSLEKCGLRFRTWNEASTFVPFAKIENFTLQNLEVIARFLYLLPGKEAAVCYRKTIKQIDARKSE